MTVTATSADGSQSQTVTTTAIASNPNPTPPSAPGILRNTATTAEIAWTPSDPTLPTLADASYDGGTTWQQVAVFPAGATTGTVYHLRPDHLINLRLRTAHDPGAANNGGGGGTTNNAGTGGGSGSGTSGTDSGANGMSTHESFSVSAVEGDQSIVKRLNTSWAVFQGTSETRYLRRFADEIEVEYEGDTPYETGTWFAVCDGAGGKGSSGWSGDDSTPPTYPEEYQPTINWNIDSDTTGRNVTPWFSDFDGTGYIEEKVRLDTPYTFADFKAAVEGVSPDPDHIAGESDYTGALVDGVYEASVSLHPVTGAGYLSFLGPSPTATWGYDLTRLQYKFRCNQDPDGVIVYDVVFLPENGDPPKHEVHRIATRGKTVVGEPDLSNPNGDDKPLLLDPLQHNDGANGKYYVVPIQLQVNEWKDQDSGGTNSNNSQASTNNTGGQPDDVVIDDTTMQSGQIGNMVDSIRIGQQGAQRHFVSPKLCQSTSKPYLNRPTVTLRAQIPHELEGLFSSLYHWECKDNNNNSAGTANGILFDVPRNNPGCFTVKLVNNALGSAGDMDQINVWIVWSNVTATLLYPIEGRLKYEFKFGVD